jgi:hypothetical protein
MAAELLVRTPGRLALGLAAVTFCGAWPLASQEPAAVGAQGLVWTLENLQAGQCVRFLMNPGVAAKHLRPGTRLVRADQDQSLHQALKSVVAEQSEFATWIPASLCFLYADAMRLGRWRLSSKDSRRKQMLGTWTMAATEQGGGRRDIVVDLFGSGGDFVRAAEAGKVRAREARSAVSKAPGGENDLYDIRIGRTRLIWNGRAVGDSARVDGAVEERWLARGASGLFWRGQSIIRPVWSRSMVGVLTVEGNDGLANALKGSPTRFVGPVYYGGGGEIRFAR